MTIKSTIIALLVLIVFAGTGQEVAAATYSETWNSSVSNPDLYFQYGFGVECAFIDCGYEWGLRGTTAGVGVTYKTTITDEDTGSSISKGASLIVGTRIRVERDFSTQNSDIFWYGSGETFDTPYGYWEPSAGPPTSFQTCEPENLVDVRPNRDIHIRLHVDPPTTSVTESSSNLSCVPDGIDAAICTVTGAGSFSFDMNFAPTNGHMYYSAFGRQNRDNTGPNVCRYDLAPMIHTTTNGTENWNGSAVPFNSWSGSAGTYNWDIGAATESFTMTGAAVTVDAASCGFGYAPATVIAGNAFTAFFTFNNDGTSDWSVPGRVYAQSANPLANSIWGRTGLNLGSLVVSSGSSWAASHSFTAPLTLGPTTIDFQMNRNGSTFGDVCSIPTTVVAASCTGPSKLANSTYFTGDETGLSGDTPAAHNLINTAQKCEYFCDPGFVYNGFDSCLSTPAPVINITASPSTISAGDSTTLNWTVTDATSCFASNGWSGVKSSVGGSEGVSPVVSQTYQLSCTGLGGTTVAPVAVTVNNPAPVVNAGGDQNITLPTENVNPSLVSASDPNTPLVYNWIRTAAPGGALPPNITNFSTTNPTFNDMTIPGTYTYQFTVEDSLGAASSDTMDVIVTPTPTFSCVGGVVPVANASYFPADESGLTADVAPRYSATNNTSSNADKCEWTCNTNYSWNGTSCILPDLEAVSLSPSSGASYAFGANVSFSGEARNNTPINISDGGWSNIIIDLDSDGSALTKTNMFGAATSGSFVPNQVKALSYSSSAFPIGTHRYRFQIDDPSAPMVAESNESNNESLWRSFTITTAPQPDLTSMSANAVGVLVEGGNITINATVENTGAAGTVVGFDDSIEYRYGGVGGWTAIGGVVSNTALSNGSSVNYSRSHTISGALNGEILEIRHIVDVNGNVTESDESNTTVYNLGAITVNVPTVPTNLRTNPGVCDSGLITIEWDAVAGADTYTLLVDGSAVTGLTGLAYPHDPVLNDGALHRYQVEAFNSGGGSTFSAEVSENAPLDCATANGVNLTPGEPSVTLGSATQDGVNGEWDNVLVREVITNTGLGTMPAASTTHFIGTLDVVPADSIPEMTSSDLPHITGIPLGPSIPTGTRTRSLDNVTFGSYRVCVDVNNPANGPTTEEYPASASADNQTCSLIPAEIPVPRPPMSITTSPELVRAGQPAEISWSAETTYPLECVVSGPGGFNETFRADQLGNGGQGVTQTASSVSINNSSEFTLRCEEMTTNTPFTETIIVEVVPDTQEF